jgi:hypothetical protein
MSVQRRELLGGGGAALLLALAGGRAAQAAPGFRLQTATALPPTPDTWSFQVFDNGDLVGVQRQGARGRTELHIVSASSGFRRFALQTETALEAADAGWDFVALANRDLIAVRRSGASGKTEVHVLDGSAGYRAYKLQTPTVLPATDRRWAFGANSNGDLVCINRLSVTGQTEVLVLDAKSRYQRVALQADTALHATDTTWDFGVLPSGDIVAFNRGGSSARSEVHVLDASRRYGAFRRQAPTPLPPVTKAWQFALRNNGEVYAVLTDGGSSGKTEVHIFDALTG